jgi:RND family efflux transporter MFP subunit
VAKSAYETLMADYSEGGKQIRAPFDGFVKAINIDNGGYVNQGGALVTIGSHRSRLLETQVSPSFSSSLQSIHNIWYQPVNGRWSSINDAGGSILSVGQEVEKDKPMLPVYAQVNEEVGMPEGSFTEVQIAVGNPEKGVLVPERALLEDYGSYSLIVQLSGERFERRPVKIGRKSGEYAEILEGLQAGEVVVNKGAYQVKMASMSGQVPAHGHSH